MDGNQQERLKKINGGLITIYLLLDDMRISKWLTERMVNILQKSLATYLNKNRTFAKYWKQFLESTLELNDLMSILVTHILNRSANAQEPLRMKLGKADEVFSLWSTLCTSQSSCTSQADTNSNSKPSKRSLTTMHILFY